MTTSPSLIEKTINGQIHHVFDIEDDKLKQLYLKEKSSKSIAEMFSVDKKTILSRLQKLSDWNDIKSTKRRSKSKPEFVGICENCKTEFKSKRKRKYCTTSCYKNSWAKKDRKINRETYIKMKQERRANREKKLSVKGLWREKYLEVIKTSHKRNLEKVTERILKRADSAKNSMVTRSNKVNVKCDITLEDVRQLILENYGTKCNYCDAILTINNMVFDHIIPISKDGESTKDNIQLICKKCNGMKGSLNEHHFQMLLDWLNTVPDEVRKDISIRLSRGFH